MPGAELFLLNDERDRRFGKLSSDSGLHLVAAVSDHDDHALWVELERRLEHPPDHRPSTDRMQDLWQRGVHALALACSEDDNTSCLCHIGVG